MVQMKKKRLWALVGESDPEKGNKWKKKWPVVIKPTRRDKMD